MFSCAKHPKETAQNHSACTTAAPEEGCSGNFCIGYLQKGGVGVGELPKGGLIGKTVQLLRRVAALRVSLYAANAGFFMILSMFPALVVLLGLLRHTGLGVESLAQLVGGLIPEALETVAEDILLNTYANSSGSLVGLSALTAMWSASRGIYGLLTGLNAVYGVREDRGWLTKRLICVGYTFAFFLVLLLTLVLQVFGDAVLALLARSRGTFTAFLAEAVDLRFFLLLILQTLTFTLMFMALPNRRTGFRENLPGALLASAGWLVFSDLYSIYVEHFSGLGNVYGSVYALALSMLWLYCCLSIVFYGGALNRYLREKGAGE